MIRIDNGRLLTMDMDGPYGPFFEDGSIVVEDHNIYDMGPTEVLKEQYDYIETVYDAKGKLIMPGMIDTHWHGGQWGCPVNHLMAYGKAGEPRWYTAYMPWEELLWQEGLVGAWTARNAVDCIRKGVTCVAEHGFHDIDDQALAYEWIGLRALMASSTVTERQLDQWGIDKDERPLSTRSLHDAKQLGEEAYKKYPKKSGWLVHGVPSARQVMVTDWEIFAHASELAVENDSVAFTHLEEMPQEMKYTQDRHGQTPSEYVAERGGLRNQTIAHSIYTNAKGVELYHAHGVAGVALCPQRVWRRPEVLPSRLFKKANIPVGLGSDGLASGPWSSFEGIRLNHSGHNLGGNGRLMSISPYESIAMATCDAARALRIDDEVGRLKKGLRADFFIAKPDPTCIDLVDAAYHLRDGDVETVFINGKVVMRDRKILAKGFNEVEFEEEMNHRVVEMQERFLQRF